MPPQLPSAFLASDQSAVNLFTKLQKGRVQLKNGKTYTAEQSVKERPAGRKKLLETH
jgi:hypothetical protein